MTGTVLRQQLLDAHEAALDAVSGRPSVARYLTHHPSPGITHAVAVGKAAADMAAGALDVLGNELQQVLVVTKHGHLDGVAEYAHRIRGLECAHPVPDQSCLDAGQAAWAFFEDAPANAGFLFMISGGASSLLERLPAGLDATFLARVNDWLLAGGYSIGVMNRVRKRISSIKGGRLAHALAGRSALCLMISDVPGDDPKVIGSGPLIPHHDEDMDVSDLVLPEWASRARGVAATAGARARVFASAQRTGRVPAPSARSGSRRPACSRAQRRGPRSAVGGRCHRDGTRGRGSGSASAGLCPFVGK